MPLAAVNNISLQIDLSDVLSGISLVFVIIGGIWALHKWNRNLIFTRAKYINELTEKISSDHKYLNFRSKQKSHERGSTYKDKESHGVCCTQVD